MKKKTQIQIAIFLLLFSNCGDPGYRMRPSGWESTSDHEWTKQFGDFEIRSRGIRGLIGDWSVDPDLQIHNNTKSISVETAELLTPSEKFFAQVYGSEPIPPSTSGYHLPVAWKFEDKRAAYKVLGDHCEIDLHLKIGGERQEIKIEYEKY